MLALASSVVRRSARSSPSGVDFGMILFMFACQAPTPDGVAVLPSSADTAPTGSAPTPSLPPLPAAADFTAPIQGGATMRLSDHAGDLLLVDISGFT